MVSHKGSMPYTTVTESTQETNRQNTCGREVLKSRGKRTRREALPEGDKIEWYRFSHPGQES